MDESISIILILVVLIILSAYFSATETSFSSLNKIKMINLSRKGNKKAKLTLKLSDKYDEIISTILIGNNIVNIAAASLATVLFTSIWGEAGVTISTIVMTIVVLIFGEVSPKSLAKDIPESFAMFSSPILSFFCILLKPLNFLFCQWKKLLSRIFKIKNDNSITGEEILTIVKEAQNMGGINYQEGELIRSAIEFNDQNVIDVFTPRVDVVAVEDTTSKEELIDLFTKTGYSRIPVYHGNIDNIIGIINEKDFFYLVMNNSLEEVKTIIKSIAFIPPTMKISKLLRLLQNSKSHMAVIIDEYGGTMGIVTLEDVLEELVGEIWDEHDEIVNEIQKVDENEYLVTGSAKVEKLFEELKINQEVEMISVNGWVTKELGRIPVEGDKFKYKDYLILVVKVNRRRVLQIKIVKE